MLGIASSTAACVPVAGDPEDALIKLLLDEIYLKDPCLGSRKPVTVLERDHGIKANRKRVRRLRDGMGATTAGTPHGSHGNLTPTTVYAGHGAAA